MTWWSMLLLGVGVGLRHATDADHLIAVSTLVQREPGLGSAVRVAALWGAGHSATFLGIGLSVVLVEMRLPPEFERVAGAIVGAMLLGLGFWHLSRRRSVGCGPTARSDAMSRARPVIVGLIHGLAGSAGVALLAVTTMSSRSLAIAYLGTVALGSLLGMVALTVVLARPIGWSMRREGVKRVSTVGAALLSIALGAAVTAQALLLETGR